MPNTPRNLVADLIEIACSTERSPEGLRIQLAGDGGYAVTPNKYKVPLTIETEARTDSTNIRLKFHNGQAILNWENNLDELRWHDPVTGEGRGVAGAGRVPTDEWVRIRWTIEERSAALLVNGEERCRFEGDFRQAAGQIGIGAAHGSTVTVRSFEVIGEPTDQGSDISGPPRLTWDGGYIYVDYDRHAEAVAWYDRHLGLKIQWPTWDGKQDSRSVGEFMSSLAIPEGGLVHLKSVRASQPLAHFSADWDPSNTRIRYAFACPDLAEAESHFRTNGIESTRYRDLMGAEALDVQAFDGTMHTLVEDVGLRGKTDARAASYRPWRVKVPNLDTAARWYESQLGLSVVDDASDRGWIMLDGWMVLELAPASLFTAGQRDGRACPYFRLRDMDAERQVWAERGLRMSDAAGEGWRAMHLYDPFGNRVNFWQY